MNTPAIETEENDNFQKPAKSDSDGKNDLKSEQDSTQSYNNGKAV